jgi:4'-phosphopantetheinyl transferase
MLRSKAQDAQRTTFFRLWTLKEAFIKATGEGLSRPLDSFSFALDPVSITFDPADADDPTRWQFVEQRPTPRHLLALAVRDATGRPVKLSVRQIHPTT